MGNMVRLRAWLSARATTTYQAPQIRFGVAMERAAAAANSKNRASWMMLMDGFDKDVEDDVHKM